MDEFYNIKLKKAQQEYASKHRNCNHCIFYTHVSKFEHMGVSFNECEVKDKIVKHPKLKAFLCQYYQVK